MDNITKIWLVLLFLTSFSVSLGWLEFINYFLFFLLLVTTFLKGQLVIDYFMKLREVQLKYRIIPTIWLGTIIVIIGFLYYLPVG